MTSREILAACSLDGLISEYRNNRLAHLSEAGPKELWAAVKDHGRKKDK